MKALNEHYFYSLATEGGSAEGLILPSKTLIGNTVQ
jgi:hypothetical protein